MVPLFRTYDGVCTDVDLGPDCEDDVVEGERQGSDRMPGQDLDLQSVCENADAQPSSTIGASFESSFLAQTAMLGRRKRKKRSLDPWFVPFDDSTSGP